MQRKRFNTVEIVVVKPIKLLSLSLIDYIEMRYAEIFHTLIISRGPLYAKMLDFCNFHSFLSTIFLF